MVWHLSLITILSLLPGALATGWDDFADDLATDLVCCLSHTYLGDEFNDSLILGASYIPFW